MTVRINRSSYGLLLLAVYPFFAAFFLFNPANYAVAADPPRLFVLEPKDLVEIKNRLNARDAALQPALNKLLRDADRAVESKPASVMDKEMAPPSRDKHDYMSIAPYWWPNPSSPDGLPYVRRDGEVNPERDQTSDRKRLDTMVQNVKTLALSYFFTGREDFAAQAAKWLRVWFLDDATRMNPNLRYAQAIPGRNNGRGAGIIETHNFPELLDAVGLLAGSKSWDAKQQQALQNWFSNYLNWLLESPEGQAEAKAQNNHGSWYDTQVAGYALFVGKKDIAAKILKEMARQRIAKQIEPDGRQPLELERIQAWDYSLFNLEALFDAAALSDKLGIDLWNFSTPDGRGLRRALDWLTPFAVGDKKWNHQQISGWQPEKLAPLLRRAALRYRQAAYEAAINKLTGLSTDNRMHLLYPKPNLEAPVK